MDPGRHEVSPVNQKPRFPAQALHNQIVAALRAWGWSSEPAEASATVMVEADLNGIDSHGLCTMVEVLSALLSGATAAPFHGSRTPGPGGTDTGHFFLALNTAAFRSVDEFHADMDRLIDTLRATPPADPARPVMVPGDIEWRTRGARQAEGIPLEPKLLGELAALCARSGIDFQLNAPMTEQAIA